MSRIESVERFAYRGKTFATEAAAIDHAEDLVSSLIKPALLEKGFTVTEWVKVCGVILANREALLDLLDY